MAFIANGDAVTAMAGENFAVVTSIATAIGGDSGIRSSGSAIVIGTAATGTTKVKQHA